MDWNLMILGNPLGSWLTALTVALGINLGVGLVKRVIVAHLAARAEQTDTALDDALIAAVRRTKQGLILLVSLYIGARNFDLPARVDTILQSVATVAIFMQIGLWGSAALNSWAERYHRKAMAKDPGVVTSFGAITFVGRLVLWAVVLLVALDNLGVNVTALIAGLGVGGIAVALAVQNILGDLFASFSIVIDKPFVVGDFIIVDSYMGTVEHVGLKTTRLRSLSGEQIVFPNSDLLKARVRNYKRMYERRVVFTFGVTYETPPDRLERVVSLVREIVERHDIVRFDRAHFFRFGESSLDFEVVYWMKDPDYKRYMDVQQAINLEILRRLAREGVSMAFPTRTIKVDGPVVLERAAS
ncbi:Small-conductance mechanosensitive channel [Fontimonas thermophila]|uniref:Small-conductance mechanosensitive channel n=1 Tax=Fontimonas thermophila TaxID=1076937 RepID=A0A1I2JEZ0_9GAMM|nr:mechanosensitive ion channel family protein [Fontimonas thermophila]SFF53405.1 Small-conductance mechanosensitive channel [Fontimonas thermophila]